MHSRYQPLPFRKTLLAVAVGAALAPHHTWALELVQEPPLPTSKSAFVAPNVIISVDDSGSMDYCLNKESSSNCLKNINNTNRSSWIEYSCTSSSFQLYNNDCISRTSDNTKRNGRSPNYTCEAGYILKGNNCYKLDNSLKIETTKYSCPSPLQLDTSTNDCYNWVNATNNTTPNKICPADYTYNAGTDKCINNNNPEDTVPVTDDWPVTSRRINVLKYSLKKVFNDNELIPSGKIRLAWQAMHNNSGSPDAGSVNSSSMKVNSMRSIDAPITSGGSTTTHRARFLDFVDSLDPGSGTPSHKMFSQADKYMRRSPLTKNSPWSSDPGGTGSKATEYLGCRRNYHIMMTDGRWNETATAVPDANKRDNATNLALPSGPAYTGSDSALYRDTSTGTTLADWAFYSWAVPLQDVSLLKDGDKLKPSQAYEQAPATETFGSGASAVTLKKFWNPKYNPATWPHMVTYTIGFSEMAYKWDYSSIVPPTEMAPFGYDGSFPALAKGTVSWPNLTEDTASRNALDLWHAALNGRGRFYAIQQGAELERAFRDIIGKIKEESAPLPDEIAGGGSTTGYNVSQNNAGIFASVYSPKEGWSGYITATRAIEPEQYACPTEEDPDKKCIRFTDVVAGWEGKTTADRLDDPAFNVNNRVVLTWNDESSEGIPFNWTSYSTGQKKALLGVSTSAPLTTEQQTVGQNIVDFIRGDHSLEGNTPEKPFRVRSSRQGDVVNSEIWYTSGPIASYAMGYSDFVKKYKNRTPILYVGGNDGMLHGFNAENGTELLAYVPRGVVSGLKNLADPNYQHRYYVDGSPMTGDVLDGDTWKTLLVGTLGAGGKGYFVLDVTDPSTFSNANADDLVVLDRTRGNSESAADCSTLTGSAKTQCEAAVEANKDIGNITAHPGRNPANLQLATQITRLNNGRWAVVMGNGYNSANQRPVLLVQYLDGDRSLKRIQATTDTPGSGNAQDNGLASPALADINGDGKTDVVYAGDNLGNLWKFDLTSTDDTKWAVAFGNNKPLFTARGRAKPSVTTRDQVQPITAPPIVRANDRYMTVGEGENAKTVAVGGMMVAFGTGRNLTNNDRRTDIDQPVQTLYSVLDNTRYRTVETDGVTHLEVHPGKECGESEEGCVPVPAPAPVGQISASGSPLAKQSITTVDGDFGTVTATQELKEDTWSTYKGWYLDLPATGERILKPMQFFDGSNILAVYSESPAGVKNSESDNINESCVPVKVDTSAGSQYRTLINIQDGKRSKSQLVDYNADGVYNAADKNVDRAPVKTGTPLLITEANRILDLTGGGGSRDALARMPEQSTRPSWRQLK